jgi:hypothetical protein
MAYLTKPLMVASSEVNKIRRIKSETKY